jgi:hypothetical protein
LIGIDPFRTSVCPFLIDGVRCGICQCHRESFTASEGHPTPPECPTPIRRSAGLFDPCRLLPPHCTRCSCRQTFAASYKRPSL